MIYFKVKTPKIPQHLTYTWFNLNTEDRQIWLLHFSRNFLFTLKKERSVVTPVMWLQNSIKILNFLLCVTCFLSPWVGAVITVQFLYPIFISWSFQELHKIKSASARSSDVSKTLSKDLKNFCFLDNFYIYIRFVNHVYNVWKVMLVNCNKLNIVFLFRYSFVNSLNFYVGSFFSTWNEF